VLDVLLRRRAEASRPGTRADGHRVALVIEGGGMRGVYSGGMVRALEQLGLRDGFDEIYGTSAGAFNAAAFAVGNGAGAADIYPDDLSGTRFIDPRRALARRGPLIGLDYLVDDVLENSKPLDLVALADSDVPVRPIATSTGDLRPHALRDLRTPAEWKAALRATACVPVLAGPPVPLNGRTWIDGAVSEPIAVARALDDGATHVLALLSRPPIDRAMPAAERGSLLASLLNRISPGLGHVLLRSSLRTAGLSIVEDAAHPRRGTAKLLALRPSASCGIGALTTDERRLRLAADTGTATVHTAVAVRS
jgi:predicted patatin/cPLA2 family phospholipase